jgi:hypothetical protein
VSRLAAAALVLAVVAVLARHVTREAGAHLYRVHGPSRPLLPQEDTMTTYRHHAIRWLAVTALVPIGPVLLVACGGDTNPTTGPDSDRCKDAIEVMLSFDTDPSTPDVVDPSMEDLAEFNVATDEALEACEEP